MRGRIQKQPKITRKNYCQVYRWWWVDGNSEYVPRCDIKTTSLPKFCNQIALYLPWRRSWIGKNNIVDARGMKSQFFIGVWKTLFNWSVEFHSVFEMPSGSSGLHHLSSKTCVHEITKNNVYLVGQLIFLLILKQQVHRSMTMATIAHATYAALSFSGEYL